MKLQDFLSTLVTKEVMVTLIDYETENELVTLKSPGYASLEDTIEARAVRKWEILSATRLSVLLGDVITDTSNNTDPSDPNTDPSDPNTDPSNP